MGRVRWKKVCALQKHLRKGKRGAAEGGRLLYGMEGEEGLRREVACFTGSERGGGEVPSV